MRFLIVISIFFSLQQECYTMSCSRQVLFFRGVGTPTINLVPLPVLPSLMSHRRNCTSSEMIPFIETPIAFGEVSSVGRYFFLSGQQRSTNLKQYEESIKKLSAEYFNNNFESLKRAILYTRYDKSLFGTVCLSSKYLSKNKQAHRHLNKNRFFPVDESDETGQKYLTQLQQHAAFYKAGQPVISNFEYDHMKTILKLLRDKRIKESSDPVEIKYLKEEYKSTQDTYLEEDVKSFFEKTSKSLGISKRSFDFSPHVNGMSIKVTYKNGYIYKATNTGPSNIFERDVTEILRVMPEIPNIIAEKEDVVFSGCLYLTKKDLAILNAERTLAGKTRWLDPLSAINFVFSLGDPLKLLDLKLRIFFDDIIEKKEQFNFSSAEVRKYFRLHKFPFLPSTYHISDTMDQTETLRLSLLQFPFVSFGMKVAISDGNEKRMLRDSDKHFIIYKTAPTFYKIIINYLYFTVKQSGTVIAVFNFDPITVNGKLISKFTSNNKDDFRKLGVNRKDTVIMEVSPGLDPQVFLSLKDITEKLTLFPEKCPKCRSQLEYHVLEGKQVAYCSAHLVCMDDSLNDFSHFISKDALNIPSVSDTLVAELIKKSIVLTTEDLFNLSESDWELIESVSINNFIKIISEIKNAKNTTLARFIYALNIPLLTPIMAQELAFLFGNIDRLQKISMKDLSKTRFIDKETFRNIVKFFSINNNIKRITSLLNHIKFSEISSDIINLCYRDFYTQDIYSTIINIIKNCDENNTITDYEYDLLADTARKIEKEHPDWTISRLPKSEERALIDYSDTLVLQKTYSQDVVQLFCEENAPDGVVIEPKINGIACTLQYVQGELHHAFTRHNKTKSFDIIHIVKRMRYIPKTLNVHFTGLIRGELFISDSSLIQLNDQRSASGLNLYVDPAAVIGTSTKSMGKSKEKEMLYNEIQFAGYHITNSKVHEKRTDLYDYLTDLGFSCKIMKPKVFYNANAAFSYASNAEVCRAEIDVEIDGMVLKKLYFGDESDILLSGKKYTPGMLGYKFSLEKKKTTIKSWNFGVSRNGILNMNLVLDPVTFPNGKRVSKVHVKTPGIFANKSTLSEVIIRYAGGAMPLLDSIINKKREGNEVLIQLPINCPACKKKLISKEHTDILRCPNPMCTGTASNTSRLLNFASYVGMRNLVKFKKIIDNTELIQNVSDYYRLLPEDLHATKLFTSSDIVKIFTDIENSKKTPLDQFLCALKIPEFGIKRSKVVVRHTPTLEKLLALNESTLPKVEGNKYVRFIMKQILKYVDGNRNELTYLLDAGVTQIAGERKYENDGTTLSEKLKRMRENYYQNNMLIRRIAEDILMSVKKTNEENKDIIKFLDSIKHKNKHAILRDRVSTSQRNNEQYIIEPLSLYMNNVNKK